MSEEKKSRSSQIPTQLFIKGVIKLRHELGRAPTIHELTTFFNTHHFDENGEWAKNPEGTTPGQRNSLSVASRLSQVRTYIEDQEKAIGEDSVKPLLTCMEITGVERQKPDLNSIVLDIKSLGILAAPANMVPNSGHVGTAGNAVTELAFVEN